MCNNPTCLKLCTTLSLLHLSHSEAHVCVAVIHIDMKELGTRMRSINAHVYLLSPHLLTVPLLWSIINHILINPNYLLFNRMKKSRVTKYELKNVISFNLHWGVGDSFLGIDKENILKLTTVVWSFHSLSWRSIVSRFSVVVVFFVSKSNILKGFLPSLSGKFLCHL